MIVPRHRLDLSPADLLYALVAAPLAQRPNRRAARIASGWARSDEGLACLSDRAGLDFLLSALDLPEGDEVLLSAVTHPDMPRIVRAHGLVPVPVDLDLTTAAPRADALERALGPRARAILVAHLFGARFDLSEVAELARRHRLLLIEDCAQTILGPDDAGDPRADVSLYSFGSIKTATALGGALVRVRDAALLARMRKVEAAWPRQPRREHASKSLKYAVLVVLDRPLPYTVLVRLAQGVGFDLERFVSTTVRAFRARPGDDQDAAFTRWLRRRPSAPLLALLERRLRRFDATRGTSAIGVVEPPAGHEEVDPSEARRLMAGIVFLPVYPELSRATLERLAETARRTELESGRGFPADRRTVAA